MPRPLATKKYQGTSFTSIDMFQTHTARSSRTFQAPTNEMKVKMKGIWRWDDDENEMTNYLTGTRGGERKRRKENKETPTPTHLAQSGQPSKSKGKEIADRRRTKHRPEEGGPERKAWHNLYKARARPASACEGPKPDLGSTHEIGDQWGISQWKWCIHNRMQGWW